MDTPPICENCEHFEIVEFDRPNRQGVIPTYYYCEVLDIIPNPKDAGCKEFNYREALR